MAYDEGLADRIRDALGAAPGITEKKMFGGLAFLVDGHMSIAVRNDGGAMVRLPREVADEYIGEHVSLAVMGGREMRGWLVLDEEEIASDIDLAEWVRRTVDYSRTLPPK
ncbi:TfoX/Sxy family protein [Tsukamurella strandjordii]|uniref:TfoX/Sxy family protein n=1 Tax=Tsukamurella strandjordii TaxID=147577 RepID=A0AA90S890_9ACTN|nr:TfoX/Sxy family protein [Tsukamurella strandjordii]MDP0398525.1 TfoX/Sxy family protein [Tsukamurella strandjordii]